MGEDGKLSVVALGIQTDLLLSETYLQYITFPILYAL